MNITLQVQTDHDMHSPMAFSANWQDATHRYHVWIGLRPDVDGERVPYPVQIGDTIYKNRLEGHRHNTIRMDINAKSNAKIKAEIKRIATYDTLAAMFGKHRQEIDATDTIRAEAERLNAVYDAWKLLETATVDEKMTLGII